MVKSIPERVFDLAAGLPDPLPAEPMLTLAKWLDEATHARKTDNPNAMVLATCGTDGAPSARVVLCKQIDLSPPNPRPGVVFFTNYQSRKGLQLVDNPRAAVVFHWDYADRQARLEGTVEQISATESDAYFRSRPLLSRVGAWASRQSQPLKGRTDLFQSVREVMERFGVSWLSLTTGVPNVEIPRPPYWGGFRLVPSRVELWQGVAGRLHDRAAWTRAEGETGWSVTRLQP